MKTTRLMKVLTSVFVFFSMFAANAEKVTPEQAATAARSWIRGGYSLDRRVGRDVGAVRTVSETNGAAFHVVTIKDGGFLVMGADTTTEPVVAFASSGALVEDERNPLWVLLRGDFAARERAKSAKAKRQLSKGKTGERSTESRWAGLLAAEGKLLSSSAGQSAIADVRVDALVKSAWAQTDYRNYGYTSDEDICYNFYTPNHWPCGCVATAGAQIMRYHSYPTASVEAGTYACEVGSSARNLTMFGGAYNWDAMTLVPEFGCSPTNREAIGRLTYDVGVSVGMSYGSGGSSAAGYMLEKRFVDRFQYANAVSVIFQDGFYNGGGYPYSLDRFKAAVVPNFDAGLPVVMGISSGAGGHAVVGDGYGYSDGVFYLHVNLGWANLSEGNAWYAPPDIDDYDTIDSIVYNVYPTGASGVSIVSGRILSPEGLPVEGATVKALSGGAQAAAATSGAKGLYALKVQPGTCWIVAEKEGKSASNSVTVAACVSPKVDESGSYWDDIRPQIGNVCDNDLTLNVAGTPEPEPPTPTNLTWYTTKAEAFAVAAASGKRILLVYGRDACGNTTATRNYTCEDAEVKAKLFADYVLWYSNCDTQWSESSAYLLNFESILPGVSVIDLDLDRAIVGAGGYQSVSAMLQLLEDAENWEPPEPPENDNFADATELTGTSGSVFGTNEGATNEVGDPLIRSYSSALTTVWWKWTAPAAGSVTFDTIGSTLDTIMGVYTGSALSSLATIAEDDDGGGADFTSKCTFNCTAGTTYYVCVSGYSDSTGDISLQWALTASEDPPSTYLVTFDANGGEGSMTDQTFVCGESQALVRCAFARSGHVFAGWATTSTAATAQYADGALVCDLTEMPGGVVTLYAVWTEEGDPLEPSESVTVTGEKGAGTYSAAITMDGRYQLTSAGLPDWVESVELNVGNSHQTLSSSVSFNITSSISGTGTIAFRMKENAGATRSADWTIAGADGTASIAVTIVQNGYQGDHPYYATPGAWYSIRQGWVYDPGPGSILEWTVEETVPDIIGTTSYPVTNEGWYDIYCDGVKIDTVYGTGYYRDLGAKAGETHTYVIYGYFGTGVVSGERSVLCPMNYSLTVSPTNVTAIAEGGEAEISVKALRDEWSNQWTSQMPDGSTLTQSGEYRLVTDLPEGWKARTDSPWITLVNDAGYGESVLKIRVATNDSDVARSAVVTVAPGGVWELAADVIVSQEARSEEPPPVDPWIEETTPTNHLRYGLFFRAPSVKMSDFPGWENASRLRSLCVQNGKMLKSNTELLSISDEAVSESLQALSSRVQAGDSVLIYFGGLRIYDKRRWGEFLSVSNFVAALSALPQGVKVAVIAEDIYSAIQFVDEAKELVAPGRASAIGWCAVNSGYERVCRKEVDDRGSVCSLQSLWLTSFVAYLQAGAKDGSADTNKDGLVSAREACAFAAFASRTNAVEVVREASGKLWGEILEYPAAKVEIEGVELLAELCLGASDANRSTMWTSEPLVFEPADFGSMMECASLDQTLSAAGGVPPYAFEEVLPESGVSQLPPGLSLDPSGRFVGQCHKAGTYDFEVQVTDDKLNAKTAQFTLTVTENPNRPPALDSAFPAVSWVRLTSPGRAQEFAVSATDPEGAALTYTWTLDGEPIADATGASLALEGDDLPDDDEHILTCTVSDGVWTDYAAHSWTLWREAYEDVKAETVDGYTWYHQDGSIIAVTPQPVGRVTVPSSFNVGPATARVEVVVCEISGAVFRGCRGLTEVILPKSLEWVSEDSFDGSPDLKRISMPVGGNGCYFTRDGVLYEGDMRDCCSLVRVPEGYEAASFDGLVGPRVEGIYERAFLNCAKLTAIEVNAFSAEAAVYADFTGCTNFTAFVWKGPKPRMGDEGWFVRNGALCYGYAYSEDGYGEFTLSKIPTGLGSFTVDSSIRWIDTWAFVGATVRDLVFESTSSYTLEELLGNLTEVLVGWPEDGFVSPVKRVVYRSSGSDSYLWKTFIRNFLNDYPQADVTFEESREAWNVNWEWDVPTCDYGDRVTAYVYGWHFGLTGQPSGAVTLPAFACSEDAVYDPSSGQYVIRKTPLALAVEWVSSRALSGMEDVTSITFPYTIQWIDWGWGGEDCYLPNVREFVFEGRIPDGFCELLAAAPNLERIVYSANPRYREDWESIANEFEGVTFVKGAEPAEPQFEFDCGGDEAYLVSVWPAKGEVKVPAVWNACPVRGIDSDAFAEAAEMTKLSLPASIWEVDDWMLEEAVALEEIEVYQPTRSEFAKMAYETWFWDEETGSSYKGLRPDYSETFDFWKYDCDIVHYTSEDGALFAECETWLWDDVREEDVFGTWRRLVKCPAAKTAFDFAKDVHEVSECALAGGSHAVCFNERPFAPDCLDTALCVDTNACTVVYPYYGSANEYWESYPWLWFVRDFQSSYPEARVTFEPYFLPDAKEDYEWSGWCGEPGEGATLTGLTLGSVRNPTGAVTIPATFDGQPVGRIEAEDAFAHFGSVTSIHFPYTLRAIDFDSSTVAFGAVTELVFDGGVPEGFDELVAAMPNLKTVVYSANPRYKAEWLSVAAECVDIEFVKGEIPSEPQWYFSGEYLGDGCALDDPDGFAAVWPAPAGEVTVPFMRALTLIRGVSENAFKGCDKITKIILPSCVCDLSLRTFDDCAALEAFEFYTPTREEYEAVAPYWEEEEWDENDTPHLVRYYEPSYGEAFGFETCEAVSEFYAKDGLLMDVEHLVVRVPRAWGGTLAVPNGYWLYEGALIGCSNVTRIVFSGYSEIDNLLSLAEAPQLRMVVYPGEPWLAEYWEGVKAEAAMIPELAHIAFEPMQPDELVWNADLEGGAYLYGDERYPAFWCAGEPPADFVFPTFIGRYPLVGLGENTLAGVSNLTSITLPYTVRYVENLGCDLSGVTRLVFEGGVPEGFDELVEAAPNLKTVVYSANPRYKADWLQCAAEYVKLEFEKGGIPSEPQWYVEDGMLGGSGMWWEWDDASEKDVLVGYPCVWPAPEGAVEVPATWAGEPIYEIAAGAFYGMDKITSLKLPRVEYIGEDAFRGCTSLAAFEIAEPSGDGCEEDFSAYVAKDGVLLLYEEDGEIWAEGSGWYPAAKEGADYELPQPWIVFDGCQYLETATVTEGMVAEEYVSLATFATCPNFQRMNVVRKPGEEEYDLVFRDGLILADEGRELVGFTARAEKVTIPATVEWIRESAFAGMVGLSEVTFTGYVPSGVEAVAWACPNARIVYPSAPWLAGDWRETAASFAEDESLSNVVFAASVPTGAEWCASPEWGYGAFLYGWADPECGYSCVWGVTPEGAFELPGAVNGFPVIGVSGDAFWGLTNLTSITFPYTVESVGAVEGDLSSVTELVFWGGVPYGLDEMLASLSNVTKIVYSANPRFAEGWADFIAESASSRPSIAFEQGEIPSEPQWYVESGYLGGGGMWWEWDDASEQDVLVGFPCVWPAPEGAVEVPATWAGEPIYNIADRAFYGLDKITSLKLPRVNWIGEEAFCGCASLAAFEMDEPNVTFYEDGEFDWYDDSPYYVENGVLMDINEEFGWYPAMKEGVSCDMPYRNIVFDGCAFLETVTASAFWYEDRPLTLADFRTCPNFREVVVANQQSYQDESGYYSFRDGMVFCDDGQWLVGFLSCGERARVVGQASVCEEQTVYGADENAFAGCRNLKVAVVGYELVAEGYVSLASFGDSPDFERIELASWWPGEFEEKEGAFVRDGCELAGFAARLDKVIIPGCVSYVNDCAFDGLENLSEIVCLGAVPENFDYALFNAGVLPKITVSPNPRFAEGWAEFARMMRDEYALDVAVETRPFSGETEWCYDVEWQWNEQEGTEIACAILRGDDNGFPCVWPVPEDGRLVIPETVDGCPVVAVSSGAFCGLSNLVAVTFPATVRWLDDWCFYEDCSNLVEVTMPCSMSGFYPNDNARIHLTLVPARRVDGVGDEWTLRVDHGVGLEGDCFCELPALTEVTLAEGVWELNDDAFGSCPNLEKVTLPSSLWNIGSGAFMCCDALREVYFLGDAPAVFEDTFAESTNFTAYVCAGTTGWSGIEGDSDIPATWYAGYAEHPIGDFDVEVTLMVGADVWTNLTVAAGTQVADLPRPTEDGLYVMLGWCADAELGKAIDGSLRIPAAGEVFYANRRLDFVRHMNGGEFEFTTGEGAEAWYGSELTAPKGGAAAEAETMPYPRDLNALTDEELYNYYENGLLPHAPWMEAKVTGPCYFAYSVYRSPLAAEVLWGAEPEELVVLTVDGTRADARTARKAASGWTTLYYLVGEGAHTVRWTTAAAMDMVGSMNADGWVSTYEEIPVTATVGDIAADAFGPRKTLGDWADKLVNYRSWNEGDLARFAADEEAKFSDDADGYAARIRHAFAKMAGLAESQTFKDFCEAAGVSIDYLNGAAAGEPTLSEKLPGVNETVDRVVADDLPAIEAALADLEAIPESWAGTVTVRAEEYPVDEDIELDCADRLFLKASLKAVLATIRYVAGYDLTVDWAKLGELRTFALSDEAKALAPSNRQALVFQRFRDEQAAFFSKARNVDSLKLAKELVREAIEDAVSGDANVLARADGALHLVHYDWASSNDLVRIDVLRENAQQLLAALDEPADFDLEALAGRLGRTLDEGCAALLPNGWITRVYLGALFEGRLCAGYLPETYVNGATNLIVRLETLPDPTFAGLLPQMTIGCVSNLVDRYCPGSIEHCESNPMRKIVFETNGGSAVAPIEAFPGDAIVAPQPPVRAGYAFVDWFADETSSAPYVFSVMPDDDLTLYARWMPVEPVIDGMTIVNGVVVAWDGSCAEVTVPDGVTEIADGAFADGAGLVSVTLPAGLRRIGKRAFYRCTDLETLVIPASVEEIDDEAFRDCTWIGRVTFEGGVRRIGAHAFDNCSSLLALTLKDGTEELGEGAFRECWQLLSVTIPSSVDAIGEGAFAACDSIVGAKVPTHVQTFAELLPDSWEDITSVIVSDGETVVMDGMFDGCAWLQSVRLPTTVVEIGARAFAGCEGLRELALPDALVSLGESAFAGCSGLESIALPAGVEAIPDGLLAGCDRIDTLVVPGKVRSVGSGVWPAQLTAVYYFGDAPEAGDDLYDGLSADLVSYVAGGSRGWDGVSNSRKLPHDGKWRGRTIRHWSATSFQVTFDGNGGQPAKTVVEQLSGDAYVYPKTEPKRDGFAFKGWWIEPDGEGSSLSADSLVIAERNHTLYAQWEAQSDTEAVDVTFDAADGTVDPAVRAYGKGLVYGSLPVPVRTGYHFAGWWTAESGGERVLEEFRVPSSPTTLYARWKVNTYKVIFHANNGTEETVEQKFTYGEEEGLRANAFTWEGHKFLRWANPDNGSVTYDDGAKVLNLSDVNGGTVHLNALWEGATYEVAFNGADADGGAAMEPQTFHFGVSQALSLNSYSREGYLFAGWADRKDGEVMFLNGERVAFTEDKTLHAVWVAVELTKEMVEVRLEYNDGGNDGMMVLRELGDSYGTLPVPNRAGFRFTGWHLGDDQGAVVSSGALVFETQEKKSNRVQLLTNAAPPVRKVLLVAGWEPLKVEEFEAGASHAITYELDGGVNAASNPDEFTEDELPLELDRPTREGYKFLGWTPWNGVIPAGTASNVTFTALWEEIVEPPPVEPEEPVDVTTYTVTFDANGGKGEMDDQVFTNGVAQALATNCFTFADKLFAGWATNAATAAVYADGEKVRDLAPAGGKVALFATWKDDPNAKKNPLIADPKLQGNDLNPVETPAAALSYTGYVTDGEEMIVGLVTVKVTKKGVVTATVQLAEGTKLAKTSYKGNLGESGTAELACSKNGGKMSALVCEGLASGTIEVGNEKLGFTARSSAKEVLVDLDAFNGKVWTVALKSAPAKDLPELMNGYSVLSVTGGKKGKMKVSGVLADGTKVSVTAQGMAFGDSVVVPVVYQKKTTAFSLKLLLKKDGSVQVGNVSDWTAAAGTAVWEKAIALEPGNVKAGAKFELGMDVKDIIETFGVVDLASILPNGVPVKAVDASSGKWTLPKAGKVAFVRGSTEELDESKFTANKETDPNPAALKLTFKKKTGLFSGSFQFYQLNGTKLKKLKVTVNGAVVGGTGYGSGVVKNVGALPVTVR